MQFVRSVFKFPLSHFFTIWYYINLADYYLLVRLLADYRISIHLFKMLMNWLLIIYMVFSNFKRNKIRAHRFYKTNISREVSSNTLKPFRTEQDSGISNRLSKNDILEP